ncbi:MAG: tripartite tricarboxylate transporter TctB family protein [Candidatus Methylomirabilales bacterium]
MVSRDRVAGAFLVLFGLFIMWEDRVLPMGTLHNPGPGYMPFVLAALLAGMGALVVLTGGAGPGLASVSWVEWRHGVAILGSLTFAALALERLGYRLTIALVILFLVGVVERKGLLPTALMAAALALGTFYVFGTLLLVPLPRGPWGF